MESRSKIGGMRDSLAVVLIVVIVAAAGIGLAALTHPKAGLSETTTSTASVGLNEVTLRSNVSLGLQLVATIKPIQASLGQNISVVAQVYNTLSTSVNVTTDSMGNPAFGPCQQRLATAVNVYSGNYSYGALFNNRSQPARLLLYDPSLAYTCPEVFSFNYSFSPNSDIALVQPDGPKGTAGPVNETSVLTGYWTGSGQNYTYKEFPPGTYTIVVFAAWGQKVIGYFRVTS
ncbi:MAG TPA: hypothetical protein VGS04_05355 [Nitrososphaerales archaeon]|nr:hypothetical protein [Nitrososphaerales archaeon]